MFDIHVPQTRQIEGEIVNTKFANVVSSRDHRTKFILAAFYSLFSERVNVVISLVKLGFHAFIFL